MGLCGSTTTPRESDRVVQARPADPASRSRSSIRGDGFPVNKLLLLGAGDSGKSTWFKQLIDLYGDGFSEKDKKQYIGVIHENIISAIRQLATQSIEFTKRGGEYASWAVKSDAACASLRVIQELKNTELTPELAGHIKTLWLDEGIQDTYSHRAKYLLQDNTKYLLDKLDEIVKPSFFPSREDIIYASLRTTGIVDADISNDGNKYKVFDLAGRRNERKKWVHCFEHVTAVIFVVDINAYDQVLFEDETTNRITEALNLFEHISNSPHFRDTLIILFLNKADLFREKLVHVPLTVAFPDYKDQNTYEAGIAFIEHEFSKRNHSNKTTYCYVTRATDASNVVMTFNAVNDLVLGGALKVAGLLE